MFLFALLLSIGAGVMVHYIAEIFGGGLSAGGGLVIGCVVTAGLWTLLGDPAKS